MNKEIKWNIINSFLAGSIASISSILTIITTKEFSFENLEISLLIGTITGMLIAVNKFKDYWAKEEKEYMNKSRHHSFHFL